MGVCDKDSDTQHVCRELVFGTYIPQRGSRRYVYSIHPSPADFHSIYSIASGIPRGALTPLASAWSKLTHCSQCFYGRTTSPASWKEERLWPPRRIGQPRALLPPAAPGHLPKANVSTPQRNTRRGSWLQGRRVARSLANIYRTLPNTPSAG